MEMCGNETIAPSVSRPSPQTFHGLSCFMSRRSFLFFSFFFFTEFYRVFLFFFRLLRRITSNHDFCGRRFDFFLRLFCGCCCCWCRRLFPFLSIDSFFSECGPTAAVESAAKWRPMMKRFRILLAAKGKDEGIKKKKKRKESIERR